MPYELLPSGDVALARVAIRACVLPSANCGLLFSRSQLLPQTMLDRYAPLSFECKPHSIGKQWHATGRRSETSTPICSLVLRSPGAGSIRYFLSLLEINRFPGAAAGRGDTLSKI